MGRCSKLRKSEKLKKIQLLLNQKNLYEDQYERLLAATGDWKSNYTDYLITEPIDLVEELKRVPEADYELCTALLTMLVNTPSCVLVHSAAGNRQSCNLP